MSKLSEVLDHLGGKEQLTSALYSNVLWIYKSFKTNKYLGSSASRNILGQWAAPYPETTGYLIPTLLQGDRYLPDLGLSSLAEKQLHFFENLRTPEGGYHSNIKSGKPIVFDVAQILLGCLTLVPYVDKPEELLQEIELTRDWLRDLLNDEGQFISHHYIEDYQPTYYSRIAWPLAFAENVIDSKVSRRTKAMVDKILALQNDNHSFSDWGFRKGEAAYTHTIAYTLRGLWEYAEIVNSRSIKKQVTSTLKTLTTLIKNKNKVAATYDEKWAGNYNYICSAGNAQLALLYLIVYERTGREEYLDPLVILLLPLLKGQRRLSINRGAIPSSLPIWGDYQKMKFTNWTQKFFADALIKLLDLGKI